MLKIARNRDSCLWGWPEEASGSRRVRSGGVVSGSANRDVNVLQRRTTREYKDRSRSRAITCSSRLNVTVSTSAQELAEAVQHWETLDQYGRG